MWPNRDRKKPHGPALNGLRIRRFDELNSYRGARLGSPKLLTYRNGNAKANPQWMLCAAFWESWLNFGNLIEFSPDRNVLRIQPYASHRSAGAA